MKKNNAIALIGYIAIIAAPIMGITGLIMAVVLVCNKARMRQALGPIVMGIASFTEGTNFAGPSDWQQHPIMVPMAFILVIGVPSAIIYYFTKE